MFPLLAHADPLIAAEHTHMISFAGHLFRVTDERTKALHYFIPGEKAGSAVVR